MKKEICILLIEDNPGDARLVRELLVEAGAQERQQSFSLTVADRLAPGLQLLGQSRFDLVLLDLSLPDSQGFETVEKALAVSGDVPVVVMSGLEDRQVALDAVKTGAQDYLVKSYLTEFTLSRSIHYAIERKESQRALKQSEALLRQVIQSSPNSIFVKDRRGRFVLTNQAFADLYGTTPEGMRGRTSLELALALGLDADSARRLTAQDMEVLASKQSRFVAEEPFILPNGTTHWFQMAQVPLEGVGIADCLLVMASDITRRRQMEQELKQRTAQLEALRQVGLELNTELDLDRLLHSIVSRAIELVHGDAGGLYLYRPERDLLEWVVRVGEGTPTLGQVLRRGEGISGQVWESGEPLIWDGKEQVKDFDSCERPPDTVLGVPVRWGQEFMGVLNVCAHSSHRLGLADAEMLSMFATQAATALHNARLYDASLRHNRELALLNRVIAASVPGHELHAVLEAICRELAIAFDVPQAAAALFNEEKSEATVVAEYLAEGRPSGLGEVIPAKDNPSSQHLLQKKTPLVVDDARTDPRLAAIRDLIRRRGTVSMLLLPLTVDGKVVGSLGVDAIEQRPFSAEEVGLAQRVADQTSAVLSHTRLLETQRRLSTAVEQAAEAIVITDAEGTIVYANPAFGRITGFGSPAAIGEDLSMLCTGEVERCIYQQLQEAIANGQGWQGRVNGQKKGGGQFRADAMVTPVRSQAGEIVNFVVTIRDVTREIDLEEQFQQAQKLEALGRLAGGIAHDFNNLLTVIHLSTRLLERQVLAQDPLRTHVDRIQEAGQRAANLTKQLLSFSRQDPIEPRLLSLNSVVGDMERMLQRIIGEDIRLTTAPGEELWAVNIDPTQLEQVVMNLAINARDAMPQGGMLRIATDNVVIDEVYAAQHVDAQPGEFVRLTVSDTGVGMDDAVKERIFEPFFTTKEHGKGTGLGLATVFGIVKQNGGHIGVYSEIGQGTTFRIYLPRAGSREAVGPSSTRATEPPVQGGRHNTETILLVEDEELVRELATSVLQHRGYRVLAARDGAEALQASEQHQGTIHLLLTDAVMPGMSGRELAQHLQSQRPEMQVLYMSGHGDEAIANHGEWPGDTPFLPKPFSVETLTTKIRAVLSGS